MAKHGAKPEQITEIAMDMSPAYIAGAKEYFPVGRAVFDAFHIMKMAGQALDKVRKDLARQGADLRGGLWGLTEQCLDAQPRSAATSISTHVSLSGLGTRGGFA
jgi:transposase